MPCGRSPRAPTAQAAFRRPALALLRVTLAKCPKNAGARLKRQMGDRRAVCAARPHSPRLRGPRRHPPTAGPSRRPVQGVSLVSPRRLRTLVRVCAFLVASACETQRQQLQEDYAANDATHRIASCKPQPPLPSRPLHRATSWQPSPVVHTARRPASCSRKRRARPRASRAPCSSRGSASIQSDASSAAAGEQLATAQWRSPLPAAVFQRAAPSLPPRRRRQRRRPAALASGVCSRAARSACGWAIAAASSAGSTSVGCSAAATGSLRARRTRRPSPPLAAPRRRRRPHCTSFSLHLLSLPRMRQSSRSRHAPSFRRYRTGRRRGRRARAAAAAARAPPGCALGAASGSRCRRRRRDTPTRWRGRRRSSC